MVDPTTAIAIGLPIIRLLIDQAKAGQDVTDEELAAAVLKMQSSGAAIDDLADAARRRLGLPVEGT